METATIIKTIAALVLLPAFGAILNGVDRKLTARIQGRQGPPLLQPVYDVLKLFGKEAILVNRNQIVYACMHLGFIAVACTMLVLGQDMLMAIFVLAFGGIALILGALSVRSPYSRIGAHREIMQMLSYEPILLMLAVGIFLLTGSFLAGDITHHGRPLLLSLPLIFIAFMPVAAIKLRKSPFDFSTSHHGHQEIVKGLTLEFAGPYLGMIEIAHWYESSLIFIVFAAFWATNWFVGLLIACVGYFGEILADNLMARLTWRWMLVHMWTVGLGLAVTNLIWLYWK